MNPTSSVLKFAGYMSEWCQTGDDIYRLKLEDEVFPKIGNNQSGAERCLVDDGLMKIFAQRDTTGLLSQIGTSQVDSYLQALTKAIGVDMQYMHEPPVWHKEYKEPVAFEEKVPIQFASMDFSTSGAVKYSGTDLFFVQGNYIVKIVDYDDPLAKAIKLYSKKDYKEAFRIFRELAYSDPNNYTAQYYTAVMEVKKQGCGYLGKIRDLEAAWWIARGKVAYSFEGYDIDKKRMMKLHHRYSIDESCLPYNTNGKDFYLDKLMTVKIMSEGLMPFKKNSKDSHMGYMDESGKVVIPCNYELTFPFNSNGLALIRLKGKYGYINRTGDLVIPAKYSKALMQFKDGRTFVLQNDTLLLIDEKGNVIKEMGIGFDSIFEIVVNGQGFAHNKNSDLWYAYDFDGNIMEAMNGLIINYKDMSCYKKNKNGEKTKIGNIIW